MKGRKEDQRKMCVLGGKGMIISINFLSYLDEMNNKSPIILRWNESRKNIGKLKSNAAIFVKTIMLSKYLRYIHLFSIFGYKITQ